MKIIEQWSGDDRALSSAGSSLRDVELVEQQIRNGMKQVNRSFPAAACGQLAYRRKVIGP